MVEIKSFTIMTNYLSNTARLLTRLVKKFSNPGSKLFIPLTNSINSCK